MTYIFFSVWPSKIKTGRRRGELKFPITEATSKKCGNCERPGRKGQITRKRPEGV